MIIGKNIIAIKQTKEMIELLYELDFKIMETDDCVEGVRKIIRYRPDLVIAEINTPNLNGFTMAGILNTLQIRTPIILTASDARYKHVKEKLDTIHGFIPNIDRETTKGERETIRSEFESIIFSLDNVEVSEPEYEYRFRQHEWANLIGQSGKKRILIVEDSDDYRLAVLKKIDSFGLYDLFSASEGLEGLFKALLIEPHLILTDIKMPILDGMAMSQIFYILNKQFPIVFLTAIDEKEIREKARKAAGVLGYITKDSIRDKETLNEKIETFLSRKKRPAASG